MKDHVEKESYAGSHASHRRPPFTIIDWIVAAFSIALLVFVLLNLPPV